MLLEETDTYEWALKSWAPCTKACGGGTPTLQHLVGQPGLGWEEWGEAAGVMFHLTCPSSCLRFSSKISSVWKLFWAGLWDGDRGWGSSPQGGALPVRAPPPQGRGGTHSHLPSNASWGSERPVKGGVLQQAAQAGGAGAQREAGGVSSTSRASPGDLGRLTAACPP